MGKILKTTNGGTTWVTQISGTSSTDFYSCEFVDANTGWVVGGTWNSAYITKTTNGGTTWTAQTGGSTNMLWSVCFYNQNVGFAGGQAGTIRLYPITAINNMTAWISGGKEQSGKQPMGAEHLLGSVKNQLMKLTTV